MLGQDAHRLRGWGWVLRAMPSVQSIDGGQVPAWALQRRVMCRPAHDLSAVPGALAGALGDAGLLLRSNAPFFHADHPIAVRVCLFELIGDGSHQRYLLEHQHRHGHEAWLCATREPAAGAYSIRLSHEHVSDQGRELGSVDHPRAVHVVEAECHCSAQAKRHDEPTNVARSKGCAYCRSWLHGHQAAPPNTRGSIPGT